MPEVTSDMVAVYAWRRGDAGLEFLQLRRVEGYAGTWQPIYGGVEPGETAVQAAFREVGEEIGVRAATLEQVEHLESFYFGAVDRVVLMPVFAVEIAAEAAIVLDHEHDAERWIPAAAIPGAFMWRSQREALRVVVEQIESGGIPRLRYPPLAT